jgi:hypothetical protein
VTRVEITVDELVLRGVPPEGAHAVQAAFEARLAALAGDGEGPRAGRTEAFRRLPAIEAPAAAPTELGNAVADAVWSAVT